MRRLVEVSSAIVFAVVVVSCTAVSQQKAQPPRTDDYLFHNLKILPQNIGREELLAKMRGFKQALGVECSHCHVPLPGDPKEYDFPSDAKPEKASARLMMRMTSVINRDYVEKVEDVYTTASCWTCHRGKTQPDVVPSLPPEEEKH